MMTVQKSSVFPASRHTVFTKLRELRTLQFIAAPYVTFTALGGEGPLLWGPGIVSSYSLKLFGVLPFGIHTIRIDQFDEVKGVSSRESNPHIPVWNHHITLSVLDDTHTEYTDRVEIGAGWKTLFVYLWACGFYRHRQRKWIKLLKHSPL